MAITLSPAQCRVIGVLLEKEITTPEQYPLSLNGLTNGCNQKSNREPVTQYSEIDVQNTLDELIKMNMVQEQTGQHSRVIKYKHRFCNTEFGSLKLTAQQLGIICVMLLRGPQTPGELRTRTNRLAEFANVAEVESVLTQMQSVNEDALVVQLEREPGKRESRYIHLFGDGDIALTPTINTQSSNTNNKTSETELRILQLEQQVATLSEKITALYQRLDG